MRDVRQFARRRPGMFLLAAGATGFAIGRIVKAGGMSSPRDEGVAGARAWPTGRVGDAVTDRSTTDSDRVTQPLQADKSLGELLSELTSDLGHLFRQEVQLAKTEARERGQAGRQGCRNVGRGRP